MPPNCLPASSPRRRCLALALGATLSLPAFGVPHPRRPPLQFPRDHGAHPGQRIEWWYCTGHVTTGTRSLGFQLTFFRRRVEGTQHMQSAFAAKQLIFAHAAVTDLPGRRHWHDQRIARQGHGISEAVEGDTRVRIRDWALVRQSDGTYLAKVEAPAFSFDLHLLPSQPVLLHGDQGMFTKGPGHANAYYSQPQMRVEGRIRADQATAQVAGAGWLDHEWGDEIMHGQTAGWDWLGVNLDHGAALMALRHRRADGTTVWQGGTLRRKGEHPRDFPAGTTTLAPGRTWSSPRSGARYPLEWELACPAGRFRIRPLLDDQEVDSRASTGAFYWEGMSELLDEGGKPVGKGYLELTGYAAPLRI